MDEARRAPGASGRIAEAGQAPGASGPAVEGGRAPGASGRVAEAGQRRRGRPAGRRADVLLRRLRARAAATLACAAAAACQTPQWPTGDPLGDDFGVRRLRGALNVHRGVDLRAPVGTDVRPVLPGSVRFAGTMRGFGLVIWLDHGDHLVTVYGHLSEIAVDAGQRVTKGTVIGKTGATGNVTGPHLHLEIWRWGREVDPLDFLGRR